MKLRNLITVLLLLINLCADAQTSGRISGVIADSLSGKPIEYASVSISSGGKVLNGVVTDKKGGFILKGLASGRYSISIAFVGYITYTTDSLLIGSNIQSIDLRTVLLRSASSSLQSVVVSSAAPITENKIDRIVYNAANDITSQGGAAIDVLRKVPQVTVDIDGNVELQGSSNIRFLINGKPSAVFGNSLTDALAAIPASQIKSIEAITSPGAKYSAQGTGGIINIILKDNKVRGINGVVNGSAGTRLENGSFNLNYKNNNFGIGASLSGNQQLRSHTPIQQLRTAGANKTFSRLEQNGYTDLERYSTQAGMAFEWNLSKTETVSGNVSLYRFGNSNKSVMMQSQFIYDSINNTSLNTDADRFAETRSGSRSTDWTISYNKELKKEGAELSVSWDAASEIFHTNYLQQQFYKTQTAPYSGRQSKSPGKEYESEITVDLTLPVREDVLLETGVSAEFDEIKSSADVSVFDGTTSSFLQDPKQSFELLYKRQVYSGYASANFTLFNKFLNVKAGLRFEHTQTETEFPNTRIPDYATWFPSIMLSHALNDKQTIKLAFTKRIERPDFDVLNPFINLSDPYNISSGNPLLKPELGHNTELGYSINFAKGGNLYIAAFERINTQDLKLVTVFYPTLKLGDSVYNNVNYSRRENFGTEYNTGITASLSVPLTKKLNIRSNSSYTYRQNFVKGGNGGAGGGRIRFNLNAGYQFPANLIAEAFANYLSAFNNIQGRSPQALTYTFAFRKQFMKKRASIGVTATNIFTRYVLQRTETSANNSFSSYSRWIPYRSVGISFSWKFGKLEFKKEKEEDKGYQKELPSQ